MPDTLSCPPRDITRLAFSVTDDPVYLLRRLSQVSPSSDVADREHLAAAQRANGETAWAHSDRVHEMANAMAEMCLVTESDEGLVGCSVEEASVRERYQEYFQAFGLALLSILDEDDVLDSGRNL